MTQPHPQPIDPALFEIICAKEWFEKYGASMMPGYFEARISAYKRIEKERIKAATHTPAAPAMEYTIEQIAEIDNRIRKERKAEREWVLLACLEVMESNQGGGIHTGWILADPIFHKIESLRGGGGD